MGLIRKVRLRVDLTRSPAVGERPVFAIPAEGSSRREAVIADRDGGSPSLGEAAVQRCKASASMFASAETLDLGGTACGAKIRS